MWTSHKEARGEYAPSGIPDTFMLKCNISLVVVPRGGLRVMNIQFRGSSKQRQLCAVGNRHRGGLPRGLLRGLYVECSLELS